MHELYDQGPKQTSWHIAFGYGLVMDKAEMTVFWNDKVEQSKSPKPVEK